MQRISISNSKRLFNNPKESVPVNIWNREFSFSFLSGISDSNKHQIYMELLMMLKAGLDIKTSLEVIAAERSNTKIGILLVKIKNSIISGKNFSEAIMIDNSFTKFEQYSLKIGEESGCLNEVLDQLSAYFEKRVKIKKLLISSLSYPVFVSLFALGAITFMLKYIIPMFAQVFKRFNGELPQLTKTFLGFSNFFVSNFWILVSLIIAFFFIVIFNKDRIWFRKAFSKFLLKLPLIGNVLRQIHLSSLSRALAMQVRSGVPLLDAISLCRNMVTFYPIQESLHKIHISLQNGVSLHKAISEFDFFPSNFKALVKIGEEAHQLDVIFKQIADNYEKDVEHKTSLMGSLLEPVLIIFLGLFVGLILLAMYLPLFSIGMKMG